MWAGVVAGGWWLVPGAWCAYMRMRMRGLRDSII